MWSNKVHKMVREESFSVLGADIGSAGGFWKYGGRGSEVWRVELTVKVCVIG